MHWKSVKHWMSENLIDLIDCHHKDDDDGYDDDDDDDDDDDHHHHVGDNDDELGMQQLCKTLVITRPLQLLIPSTTRSSSSSLSSLSSASLSLSSSPSSSFLVFCEGHSL